MVRMVRILLGVFVMTLAIAFATAVGMRTKFGPVQRIVRRFNRAVMNPHQLKSAGTRGAYAAVVQHVGRISGTTYRTPVQAMDTDDGFVIALPYGTNADWVRNVLTSGSAVITKDDRVVPVDRPRLVPLDDAATAFPFADQRLHRLFHVEQCLRLHHARASPDERMGMRTERT
jgi:deazaflavin-dependent oxidoreductase (nitroreductase family)